MSVANRLTQDCKFPLSVPVLVLRPCGSAPWTANATRLCNVHRAARAVSSACSGDVAKNRQCAHPACDITPAAARLVRLEETSVFLPSKMRMNRNVPLAVGRLRRVFPPWPLCRSSFRCSPVLLRSTGGGEKKILTQSDAPLPGGVTNEAQRRTLQ